SASYINQCQTVGKAVVGSAVTNAKKEIAGTANEIKNQFSKLLNEHLEKQQHLIVQGNIIKKSVKISALVIAISCIATVAAILMI
ncbi:MAG: hypothetical protein JRI28_05765, partial [Deltaproteobacteria bacterium]|nr:hypothetical protein [Deltaproteobacteria bacterium]